MEPNHTPEPWYEGHSSSGQGIVISELTGATVAVTYDERDAPRIVACVNACAGIPTEALENGVIGEMKEALVDLLGVGDIRADDEEGHSYSCRWCGRKYADDERTPMFCESDDCSGHKARAVLSKLKG